VDGRGRPPAGYYTNRTAELWLADVLARARAGTLPSMVRTGATFGEACDEYLRYVEFDLDRKASTVVDYRSIIRAHLLPAFGSLRLEDLTTELIEAWKTTLTVCNRSKSKILAVLNGVLKRARCVHKLRYNPMADVEKPRFRATTTIEIFSPEETWALVRAAESRAGRGDLPHRRLHRPPPRRAHRAPLARHRLLRLARARVRVLRRRPPQVAQRATTSARSRWAPDVATALARLADREHWTGHDDLVFPGMAGGYLDASGLSRRNNAALARAALRQLRFHDLRRTEATQTLDCGRR
jgi:integrase-like protein